MSTDLAGVGLKLDRAKVHLKAINTAVKTFIEVDLYNTQRFSSIDALDRQWQDITWDTPPNINPSIGTVLGDFVHNVRSALDQLIFRLVEANGNNPGGHTQWPVSETEGKWRDDIVERNVQDRGLPPTSGLSDEAFKLVRDFQPFSRDKLGSAHPLFRLHRLSNEDKHRTLHTGWPLLTEGPFGLRLEPRGYLAFTKVQKPEKPMPIKDGTPFIRVKVRRIAWPPPEGVQVKVEFDSMGVAIDFYAADRHIAAVDQLAPMLKEGRSILAAALALPEVM